MGSNKEKRMEVENLVTHSLYETERSTLSSICSVKVKKRIKVVRVKGEEERRVQGEGEEEEEGKRATATTHPAGLKSINKTKTLLL